MRLRASFMAGVEGIEPSSLLLESKVLPLNDTPKIDFELIHYKSL